MQQRVKEEKGEKEDKGKGTGERSSSLWGLSEQNERRQKYYKRKRGAGEAQGPGRARETGEVRTGGAVAR